MKEGPTRVFLDITKTKGKPSGIYVRNDLREIVEKVEKEGKERVVGIVFDETYNLELLTEEISDPKIITVQYFEETKNDKGGISLRFPTVNHIYEGERDC